MKIQVQEKPPLDFLEREKNHYFDIFELEKMGHIPKHKYHDSLAARILLKRIALDNFGIMPERIKFEYRFDKPFFLIGDTTYYCTISHSKHYVACGISIGKEIGFSIITGCNNSGSAETGYSTGLKNNVAVTSCPIICPRSRR